MDVLKFEDHEFKFELRNCEITYQIEIMSDSKQNCIPGLYNGNFLL